MSRLTLAEIFAPFPQCPLPPHEEVAPAQIPEPYRQLLVHDSHMTVSMEEFHGMSVDVHVLEKVLNEQEYARRIALVKHGTQEVVQGGIVRMQLQLLQPEVRADIMSEQIPLGRVLINHDVLRTIEVLAYYRLQTTPALQEWLRFSSQAPCFGRLAWIHLDLLPVIKLFEIIPPYADFEPPSFAKPTG